MRENLRDLLLKTVSLNDDTIQERLDKMHSKTRFTQTLRYYRDRIKNPYTLSRKVYNLVLDPNGEYKKVKLMQKAAAEKQ